MDQILHNIAANAGLLVPVLYALLAGAALDLLTGLFAAAVSGTLQWTYVSEFVRGHLLQKIGPIMGTLLAGVAIGGIDVAQGAVLLAAGAAAATAYLFSVIASIGLNVQAAQTHTKGLPSTVTPATVTPTAAVDALEPDEEPVSVLVP